MEKLKELLENVWFVRITSSAIITIVSIILYKCIIHFISKGEEKSKSKFFSSNKGRTYVRLLRSIIRYIFIIVTILIILQANGVDVSSILAGVGILGVVLGLAIQDWLKDIIRGTSILSDDYFNVGDIVKYKDIEGKVLIVGLKTTKIQDLSTSNIISIANRNIDEVQIVSNFIYVRVPIPYEVSLENAEKAINDILVLVKKCNNVNNCEYKGIAEFADSSIQYLIGVDCDPHFKLQVKRDTLRCILIGLTRNNISIPYQQIDIHNK